MAIRKFYRNIVEKSKKKKFFFRVLSIIFILFAITFLSGLAVFIYYAKDLPRPEKFTERDFIESTKIYDRTGETLLYELYGETKREIVPLLEMSEHVRNAVIATEDSRFYKHHGLDFIGIARAVKININKGSATYGGSTLSQQLIRSTFLTLEKSIARKAKEVILTMELERRYSKDQILEWYLNQVPMGINIYGAEAASQTYFNKPSKDLTIAESAILAASIKAPSYYSPFGSHIDELMNRKNYVINRMVDEGYISKEEGESAKNEEIELAKVSRSIKAPHFVLYVQQYLIDHYGRNFLEEKGYKVYTTIDWDLQQTAEAAVEVGAERNKGYRARNAALVAIDPKSGQILSMVGSADWFDDSYPEECVSGKDCMFDPKLNVATYRIGRQPGSSFKPFAYVTAFQNSHTSEETVIDEPTNFGVWGGKSYTPQNYDGLYRGEISLRSALAQSLNIPAVKVLLDLAGLQETLNTARKLGLETLKESSSFYGPAIVLGGGEVKLLDMVSAYGVFATEGIKYPVISILKIEDSKGNIVEENNYSPRKVLDTEATRILNDILSDNDARAPMFGYNNQLYFANYDVAAKTGTTNDYRDAWTIGYSPNIAVGVWVGNNDNTAMSHKPSITLAGPIWREYMTKALEKFPKENFTPPKTLTEED